MQDIRLLDRSSIQSHHLSRPLSKRLLFEIRRTGGIHRAYQIWAVVLEIVHGFAKLFQLCIQGLSLCVVRLVGTRQDGEDVQWIAGED